MVNYKCSFCYAEIQDEAYFDVKTGLVFFVPQQHDTVGESRKIGTMSHAYQYMMQTGISIFANRTRISEIERILSTQKNK